MRPHEDDKELSVYIHIPFCASKCPYCDFNSVTAAQPPGDRYIQALGAELGGVVRREKLSQRPLASIYIGGGTPSLLSPAAIKKITGDVLAAFKHHAAIETTIEVNPDSITRAKLAGYKEAGINRLSIGMQSLNDGLLATLGRPHTGAQALHAYHWAQEAGFTNIGVDLIFGVPGQDVAEWREDVRRAIALAPQHLSLYGLTIEDGTPYAGLFKEGRLNRPNEDDEHDMYTAATLLLIGAGYEHYEISNFALPGFQSVHNRGYWRGRDYIGLGAGAHSYLSYPGFGRRWWNVAPPDDYMTRMEAGADPTAGSESLGRDEALTEAIMLGLRNLESGIDVRAFKERFAVTLPEVFAGWRGIFEDGLLEKHSGGVRLTLRGAVLSNEVFVRLRQNTR